jgi:ribosome-associated protein
MEAETSKSRTQKKKEDRALQRLGEELLTLSAEQLKAIDMPEELARAVQSGRQMKAHGARRRQLQYIGALMRNIDPVPIRNALERIRGGEVHKALAFKRLEAWRDALKEGDLEMLEKVLAQCPDADRQRLTQLMRNARLEGDAHQAAKASRQLFRYLQEVYR